jgi:hypothetical protein
MIKKVSALFILMSAIISCTTNKQVSGNYYCVCYRDFYPRDVFKIKNNIFEKYSIFTNDKRSIGTSEVKGDILYMYNLHYIKNNFRDTIQKNDTCKFVIKGRKLIPFKNEECFYKKTNDKKKLQQLPYMEIDTSR